MQIRLDPANAKAVRREALEHKRTAMRRRSFADIVNQMVRDWVFQMRKPQIPPSEEIIVKNAKKVFGWEWP